MTGRSKGGGGDPAADAIQALARGDREGARKVLQAALREREKAGDARAVAELHLGIGLTRLREGARGARDAAFEDLAAAARGAAALADDAVFRKALGYLAEAAGRPAQVATVRELAAAGASFLGEDGRREAGLAVAAAEAANAGPDAAREAVAGLFERLRQAGLPGEPAALAQRLEADGNIAQAGYARVVASGQALEAGDATGAEAEARAAKDCALRAVDPVLYVVASGSIAAAREAAGDRVGALGALLTCRASLADLLGPGAGKQADAMIDALEARWGREAFARTLAAHRRGVGEDRG